MLISNLICLLKMNFLFQSEFRLFSLIYVYMSVSASHDFANIYNYPFQIHDGSSSGFEAINNLFMMFYNNVNYLKMFRRDDGRQPLE